MSHRPRPDAARRADTPATPAAPPARAAPPGRAARAGPAASIPDWIASSAVARVRAKVCSE
ncbi:hypothetical protein ACWC5I_42330, partial [Kitasatospora sp. NPDC001574]